MSNSSISANLKRLANITLAGIIYYTVIIIILHFLRPDVNPVNQMTNDYAFGPFRFLMITAYFGMSLASLTLVIGLNRGLSRQARSQLGIFFLILWIVGLLIAGIFPLIPNMNQQTILGTIYQINAPLHILCLTVGAILVSQRLKQDGNLRSSYGILLTISLIMLGLFIMVGVTTARDLVFAGLGQRLFIASTLIWLSIAAVRLRA